MPIPCPHCQQMTAVPEGLLEGKFRCSHCQQVIAIPATPTAEQGIRSMPRPGSVAPAARPDIIDALPAPARRGGIPGWVIALVIGGVAFGGVLLLCLGGFAWYFLASGSSGQASIEDDPMPPPRGVQVGVLPDKIGVVMNGKGGQPVPEDTPFPLMAAASNPFRAGTQTRLREVGTIKAPGNVVQVVYSPKHDLLFLRNTGTGVWVIDVKAQKDLGMQSAREQFYDMGLSPDESVLYVADYGGEQTGYGTPVRPHHLHRYDLARRTWDRRIAPKIAGRLEVVDAQHVLLLERDQWVDVSLNRWEANQERVTEAARASAGRVGDIAYNPRTGLLYHSGFEINVLRVRKNSMSKGPGDQIGTRRNGDGTITLSADGRYIYVGGAQIEALDVSHTTESMPEPILAASRDLAFGANGYYATKGAQPAGKLGFRCTAYAIDLQGTHLWAYDQGAGLLRHYLIEGDK